MLAHRSHVHTSCIIAEVSMDIIAFTHLVEEGAVVGLGRFNPRNNCYCYLL